MGGGGQKWAWWGGTFHEETNSIFLLHPDLCTSHIQIAVTTERERERKLEVQLVF